jgi:L-fuconolactonase
MRVDAHHHFWKYTPQEYGWISEPMKVIRRDFLAADLEAAARSAGVEGAVSVQARQTVEETSFLLDIAAKSKLIWGVVGWVPLVDPKVETHLEKFAANRRLKGVRHVLQDEPANALMDDPKFNAGISKLQRFNLIYDVLIFERHLEQAIRFVDKHPKQVFVLDHIAKPRIKDKLLEPWAKNIKELARRPNLYCKISGMATEADWAKWTATGMQPYIDTVIAAFTPKRLMFGSDWPVLLVASDYKRWADTVGAAISKLSPDEQKRIWGGTAAEAYKL